MLSIDIIGLIARTLILSNPLCLHIEGTMLGSSDTKGGHQELRTRRTPLGKGATLEKKFLAYWPHPPHGW